MSSKYIVLTHELIRDKSMTMQEKIIYLEIVNLSSLDRGCIASNNHFEKSFDISKKSVSNTISSLVKKGIIESKISDRNHTRLLSIKNGGVSIKSGESKENITINNNIVEDNTLKVIIEEAINYLNLKAGTNFKSKSVKTRKLINARYNESFNLKDFYKVIDNKCDSWLGDAKMSIYLRPDTLFGTKFESYLNEKNNNETLSAKERFLNG